jgi:hypothetical protein
LIVWEEFPFESVQLFIVSKTFTVVVIVSIFLGSLVSGRPSLVYGAADILAEILLLRLAPDRPLYNKDEAMTIIP